MAPYQSEEPILTDRIDNKMVQQALYIPTNPR